MPGLEEELIQRLDRRDRKTAGPQRVYGFYRDDVPAPAMYLELVDDGEVVPVIVHNLRYYEPGMRRWDVGVVESLVLNELHELTHWAMTDEERADLDRRSHRTGRPDGHWLNPTLIEEIRWLREEYTTAFEDGRSTNAGRIAKLGRWLRSLLGRGEEATADDDDAL